MNLSDQQMQFESKSKAQLMMEQMGWQSGKGLGKEEQGMINPLIAKKQKQTQQAIIIEHKLQKKQE